MSDPALDELIVAAKDGVLFMAEIMKAMKTDPRESHILMRLNAAINAFEAANLEATPRLEGRDKRHA